MSNIDSDNTRVYTTDDDEVVTDNKSNDAATGATLGGIGGAVTGAVAGAMAGPVGAVAGAIIGGVAGAVASGAAVGAVDRVDNDNTTSGIGTNPDMDEDSTIYNDTTAAGTYSTTGTYDRAVNTPGNGIPGVQTGGHDVDGTPDTRGIMEKTADALTGDRIDDKTGKPVAGDTMSSDANAIRNDVRGDWNAARADVDNATYGARSAAGSGIGTGVSRETEVGESRPSIKTGGVANDGTPDTRGIMEKTADAITGDDVDDKTGKVVDHP